MTFDDESLSDVWKVQVVIELGGDPDFAGFDPAMIRGCHRVIDEIWLLSVPTVEFDICKEGGRVCFDGEMIVGFTLLDQVMGEFALGQEGIGRNGFALDIDGIKEGGGHLDFVSALGLIITFRR